MNKNIQNNQHYFKISQENPESSLDNFYIFDNRNPNIRKYIKSTKEIQENLNIKIKTKKQGKKLDLIIKYKNKIFLVEAKHLNTSGGGQDKQISELIEILNLKEKVPNISYISFLDGSYSNIFLSNSRTGDKLKTQRKEIKKYLKKNPNNYWLNTVGLKILFSDLVKS